jgi:hypothetical protein
MLEAPLTFLEEPMVGLEPTTGGLQNRCSATELHRHDNSIPREVKMFCLPQNPSFS